MQRPGNVFDLLEEDEVQIRRNVAESMSKRPYSPRFESRKPKGPLSSQGAHRRRNKRSHCL